jgi:hypothetical protein
MKIRISLYITAIIIVLGFFSTPSNAADNQHIKVVLQPPAGILKMGDTPSFNGAVTNLSRQSIRGLVVYLSLVSLNPGHEEPLDLEDWSAQKAVRLEQLPAGATEYQKWTMRLIQAGKFGVALTVVDPKENKPVISDLVPFEVRIKPTLVSGRILPVAIGVPMLLIIILMAVYFYRFKKRQI